MIEPALTPEEWANLAVDYGPDSDMRKEGDDIVVTYDSRMACVYLEPYQTAALCLHEQPFGFTRADVEQLKTWTGLTDGPTQLFDLADRIAALLPPESS